MISFSDLPFIDAALNATSAILLAVGYFFIRRRNIAAHRACMLSAFCTSTLFLICYVVYHLHHGTTRFQGQGPIRWAYFTILGSHTILAIAVVPMALTTLYRAWRQRFDLHKRIARRTLPVWSYVSVTGVIVYWMLYHLYPR